MNRMVTTARRALPVALLTLGAAFAQSKLSPIDKFRQLEEILPTPNEYRTASGAPGHRYWQQKVDYKIKAELDDVNQRIIGSETISYRNNSPDPLVYLWLQLDQNIFKQDSDANLTRTAPDMKRFSYAEAAAFLRDPFPGGYNITSVTDSTGKTLGHTIVKTMMRIDLPQTLAPGGTYSFNVAWNYNINNAKKYPARSGYEYFEKDGNYLYAIAQWFPRAAAYYDVYGWQHKQFLGGGEFTLEFGDYVVELTVPDDHVVVATGTLQNPDVLPAPHRTASAWKKRRLRRSRSSSLPKRKLSPTRSTSPLARRPTSTRPTTSATLPSPLHVNSSGMPSITRQTATRRWRCPPIQRKEIRCGNTTRPRRSSTH